VCDRARGRLLHNRKTSGLFHSLSFLFEKIFKELLPTQHFPDAISSVKERKYTHSVE
jgi:hypothetical protein